MKKKVTSEKNKTAYFVKILSFKYYQLLLFKKKYSKYYQYYH